MKSYFCQDVRYVSGHKLIIGFFIRKPVNNENLNFNVFILNERIY